MTTLYTFDGAGYYTGQHTVTNPYAPQPAGTTTAPPAAPEGQVPLWTGQAWALVVAPAAVTPQPTVPQSVTMRQARLALLAAGKSTAVTAAISALPSPQKEAAQIEWEYSQEVQRHNGFVAQLGPVLGLDDAALDALFVAAAAL